MIIKNLWYESDQWSNEYSIDDVNSDVMFELSDGTKWSAFFITYQNLFSLSNKNQETGECLAGQYFYADKPIFISEMNRKLIMSVLQEIIQSEPDLTSVFTKIND